MKTQADRHAEFTREFTQHEPAIRAYVRSLVPTHSDAADVLQEVAVVLWERFDDLLPDYNFKSWAFGICRYKVLSRLRDLRRNRVVLANDVVNLLAVAAEQQEQRFHRKLAALEFCFQKLPKQDRKFLISAYQPGVSIQKAARMSGRSVSGFYQWVRRMRHQLLECMQREQHSEEHLP
ncbi:sigma-70 family RNA polymerase sigma factor [Planctomicrobium sp. SH661]|uniref:sigma-70 family RNA polymerase sigma factor n=1 Tax=Planctomicrobium sp. SH661 TaxID=3448124 RepID=UPI003F5BA9DC